MKKSKGNAAIETVTPPSPRRGRPKVETARQSVTMRFDVDMLKKLDQLVKRKGSNRSALIQLAVAEMIENGLNVQS